MVILVGPRALTGIPRQESDGLDPRLDAQGLGDRESGVEQMPEQGVDGRGPRGGGAPHDVADDLDLSRDRHRETVGGETDRC